MTTATQPQVFEEIAEFLVASPSRDASPRRSSVCVALSKLTGEVVWRQERANDNCWTTPVILRVGDHDELVHNGSHAVMAFDPETGKNCGGSKGHRSNRSRQS